MTIKALWTIRTDEKSYEPGGLVKGLSSDEEERLILLGAAEMVLTEVKETILTEELKETKIEEDLKTETKPKKERV